MTKQPAPAQTMLVALAVNESRNVLAATTSRSLSRLLAIAGLMAISLVARAQCIENGGATFCGNRVPGPYIYSVDQVRAATGGEQANWCLVRGGTWLGSSSGGCQNPTPDTEENIRPRVLQYSHISGGFNCAITFDNGWAHSITINAGYIVDIWRDLGVQCASGAQPPSFQARRSRAVSCPVGYAPENSLGTGCTRPIEACDNCNALGNPITPSTGVKIQTEVDYRHTGGLEFSRHYHSFQFYEPFSTVAGNHSENRLGSVWRSNFDKKIVQVPGSVANRALTYPSGEVQYFNTTTGNEIYNYRGFGGKRVNAPGGGWYIRGADSVEFYRPDGRLGSITLRNGRTFTLTYSDGTTNPPNGGFTVDANGNPTTLVLPAGILIRVTDSYANTPPDPNGNMLSFGSNASGQIIKMTIPGGGRFLYTYNAIGNLISVKDPADRVRTYQYGLSALPHALTKIIDENNNEFATFQYDTTTGRATSSTHAEGAGAHSLTYGSGTTTVTDPAGAVRNFSFQTTGGLSRLGGTNLAGGSGVGSGVKARTYDAAGNMLSQTDFNDIKTCYAYDTRNLESVRVEGVPAATSCSGLVTPQAALPSGSRKIETQWHAYWRVPVAISEPGKRTTLAYNGDASVPPCAPLSALIPDGSASGQPIGVLCRRTIQATTDLTNGEQGFSASLAAGVPDRKWEYAYDERGNMLQVNGPRTDVTPDDVTTYTYYGSTVTCAGTSAEGCRGQVETITNAAGHVTQITEYNAHGQPLTVVDPNGLTTTLAYDPRQRLTSRSAGGESTTYIYDNAGLLTKVTLPDGSFLNYTYDNAHRLKHITDNDGPVGNRITYTLDASGNRTLEQVFDPLNQLAQTRTRVYNNLSRLTEEIGGTTPATQITKFCYDSQGNLIRRNGPLGGSEIPNPLCPFNDDVDTIKFTHDQLNRLTRVTDPNSGQVNYGYNGLDQLTSVKDPRNLETTYSYDGLSNLNQQVSPDTGQTSNTYDAAGNLLTQTDAKGQVTSYTYDALNRVTSITYHGGAGHTYAYDQGTNGKGRLTQIVEPNSTTNYVYDQKGRLASETRDIGGVPYVTGYGYDSAGRMERITYPSGRTVTYTLDSLGRIQRVATSKDSVTQTVVSSVVYRPFGPAKSFTFGNGQTYTRGFDQDGRIASYTLATQSIAVGYDEASRVRFLSDSGTPANTNLYDYDSLDRLKSFTGPNFNQAFTYDEVGNRRTKTVGANTDTYTYGTTSNRLATIAGTNNRTYAYDLNGSTTGDSVNTYAYDTRGRMVQATSSVGATDYKVNSLGQRIRKTNAQGDTIYHYDAQGKLIAESNAAGVVQKEYVYLGDMPVAVLQ